MSRTSADVKLQLLLVDSDDTLRGDMAGFFGRGGHVVEQCGDSKTALELADRLAFDVLVLDLVTPGLSGLNLIRQLRARGCECEVVVLIGEKTAESTVTAMKLGAREFLSKPISLTELDRLVRKAYEAGQLRKENEQLKAVLKRQQVAPHVVGQSPAMLEVLRLIERLGPTDEPILIQGESGTGKKLVARALHHASPLADRPLVVVNCAAMPEALLESELFGHEPAASTGTVSSKPGLFEMADDGALLIDEIGELLGELQSELLRALEDGAVCRVGSVKQRRVNVRLLATTHRDLQEEVEAGRFREDLYYRINVLTITLPPLRERKGDMPLLVDHFAGPNWQVDDVVVPTLERYGWPGNVRQLENAVERAKILAEGDRISIENLPPEIVASVRSREGIPGYADLDLDTLNKMHIAETFRRHDGNKARTARALGIGRRTLYRLLEKYNIEHAGTG